MAEDFKGRERRHLPRTNVSELSFRRFGGPTQVKMYQAIAGLNPRVLVKNNPDRVSILISNNSDSPVYIGFVPELTANLGFSLQPKTGIFQMSLLDDGEAATHEVYGFSTSDNQYLTVSEVQFR